MAETKDTTSAEGQGAEGRETADHGKSEGQSSGTTPPAANTGTKRETTGEGVYGGPDDATGTGGGANADAAGVGVEETYSYPETGKAEGERQ